MIVVIHGRVIRKIKTHCRCKCLRQKCLARAADAGLRASQHTTARPDQGNFQRVKSMQVVEYKNLSRVEALCEAPGSFYLRRSRGPIRELKIKVLLLRDCSARKVF
jgi:hypothetical protein